MGLAEITHSQGWKKFMAKLYGWGASVVILGALFKILHWPGANYMLMAGLGTEALIFFFSAFEPLHEEVDWTLVYPELAGLGEEDEIEVPSETESKRKKVGDKLESFDQMLESAGLTPDVFEKLGSGLNKLNSTANELADISEATLATQEYTNNMKSAANSVSDLAGTYRETAEGVNKSAGDLADAYKQSAEALSYSIDSLSDTYTKNSQQVSELGAKFVESYEGLRETMNVDFSALKEGNQQYSEAVGTLNKNLSALNAIFELQLSEADLDKMMEDLQGSVEESKKYHEQISNLGHKLEALNTVYGNMLAAMNVHLDK
jgi:gliding motility-associated protein GldL